MRALSGDHALRWADIPFKRGSTELKHQLDVYVAREPLPRPSQPVVVFIHGGSWQRGDKQHQFNTYQNVGYACAARGYVGIVINYRLSPAVQHPEHVRDAAAAYRWATQNVHLYGGDRESIYLCGHSAGAHIAACLMADNKWIDSAEPPPLSGPTDQSAQHNVPRPRGFIGLSGVYNVPRLGSTPLAPYVVHPAFGEDERTWRAASPVHTISALYRKETNPLNPGQPLPPMLSQPMLLLNAEEDFYLSHDAEELQQAVQHARLRAGVGEAEGLVERRVIEGTNHMTIIANVGQPDDRGTQVMFDWLDKQCADR